MRRGLDYLNQLEGGGGTRMNAGITAALDFPHDPERLRFVCFLTDGFIGNEAEILTTIQQNLGATRIFSFGIGASVNRYLMEHMAKVGRGAVAISRPERQRGAHHGRFHRAAFVNPALTDLNLDWNDADVTDVFPQRIPDVFVGRPLILTGRFKSGKLPDVIVSGEAGGKRVN